MTHPSVQLPRLPAPSRDARISSIQAGNFLDRALDVLKAGGFSARICALHPAPPSGRRAIGVTVKVGDSRVRWTTSEGKFFVPCAINYRPGLQFGEYVLYSGLTETEVEAFTAALLDRSVQDSLPEVDLGPWDPHQTDRALADEIDAHFEVLRSMHDSPFPFL